MSWFKKSPALPNELAAAVAPQGRLLAWATHSGGHIAATKNALVEVCDQVTTVTPWIESVQAKWAAAGSRIVMDSTYSDPIVQAQDEKTNGYYTFMKDQGPLFRGAPPFPFHTAVREVVAPFIYDAIAGKISTSDALDKAEKAADAEMKKLGY